MNCVRGTSIEAGWEFEDGARVRCIAEADGVDGRSKIKVGLDIWQRLTTGNGKAKVEVILNAR